jgi:hypothetical protein
MRVFCILRRASGEDAPGGVDRIVSHPSESRLGVGTRYLYRRVGFVAVDRGKTGDPRADD